MANVSVITPCVVTLKYIQEENAVNFDKGWSSRWDKYNHKAEILPIPTQAAYVGVKCGKYTWETENDIFSLKAPYTAGDYLYVRETYNDLPVAPDGDWWGVHSYLYYKADGESRPVAWRGNWTPAIHMPKTAARIFLRVTDVRVEHLHDIDYAGYIAEGIWDDYKTTSEAYHENLRKMAYPVAYRELWDSLCKSKELPLYGWEANPWVWVIYFERVYPKDPTMEEIEI